MFVASVGSVPASPIVNPEERFQVQREAVVRPETEVKPQVIHSTAADMEKISLVFNKKLQFVVDRHSNEVIVKVIDKETDKVIKELPPEELQRLHSNLRETIGFLFDERV
ncbi:MAG: flagellar protein FlaG [Treponema sp.]|jgi:flagellar protein FlaG|nr:flagellar protein FlaG [Treponema sp.]